MLLKGKKILLGITGSIAAYKAAHLVRLCVKNGAEVRVILTPAAAEFVTLLSLATLSKNAVYIDFFDKNNGVWVNHVDLGLWADIMLIAPLSASTLSKLAQGLSDNLLVCTYLSARCKVMLAPAMDLDMYRHPAVRKNLEIVSAFGNLVIPAENGELASGLVGEGRMAEPEHILEYLTAHFAAADSWKNKTVLISSGPTYESIDPVRFIGNRSSGKMGMALAETLAERGARVILVSGPTALQAQHPHIETYSVESGQEMFEAMKSHFSNADCIICAAAVSDFRVENPATEKIKKEKETPQLNLIKNPDILQWCGQNKSVEQFVIGFALETTNEEENAMGKLERKNADAIVLNSLKDEGAGFGSPTNKITIFGRNGKKEAFPLDSKNKIAQYIVNTIENWFYNAH